MSINSKRFIKLDDSKVLKEKFKKKNLNAKTLTSCIASCTEFFVWDARNSKSSKLMHDVK